MSAAAMGSARAALAEGRIPWRSFTLDAPSTTWSDVTSAWDDFWARVQSEIGPGPYRIRLSHEPNPEKG